MQNLNGIEKRLDALARLLVPDRLRIEHWPDGWIRLRWGDHKIVKVIPSKLWDAL